jgi:hypothetical protein
MSDVVHSAVRQSRLGRLRGQGDEAPLLPLLRKEVGASGVRRLPLDLVFGTMATVTFRPRAIHIAHDALIKLEVVAARRIKRPLREEISL